MHTPQTIVIIGGGSTARGIATGLANGYDRVLLCEQEYSNADEVVNHLQSLHPFYNIEAVKCSYEAVWESDIIILTLGNSELSQAASKIKLVANQKIVVTIQDKLDELMESLPNSKVVRAFGDLDEAAFYQSAGEKTKTICSVTGADEHAVNTVSALVRIVGFHPVTPQMA
jgi:predicted dinucleotide-binding enzyme